MSGIRCDVKDVREKFMSSLRLFSLKYNADSGINRYINTAFGILRNSKKKDQEYYAIVTRKVRKEYYAAVTKKVMNITQLLLERFGILARVTQ